MENDNRVRELELSLTHTLETVKRISQEINTIDKQLTTLELRHELLTSKAVALEAKLVGYSENFAWVIKTIVAILIAAMVGFIIKGGLVL
jgi:chromosome segregation ATPase